LTRFSEEWSVRRAPRNRQQPLCRCRNAGKLGAGGTGREVPSADRSGLAVASSPLSWATEHTNAKLPRRLAGTNYLCGRGSPLRLWRGGKGL